MPIRTGSVHDANQIPADTLSASSRHPGLLWASSLRLVRNPALLLTGLLLLCSFASVQAQTFEPIPALNFTKAFQGADPLPQVISLATTNAAFRLTVNTSTSTGGSWLSITTAAATVMPALRGHRHGEPGRHAPRGHLLRPDPRHGHHRQGYAHHPCLPNRRV